MSSADLPPLLRLPLHTIAHILSESNTIQELGPIILSHSIFRDALQDNLQLVASAIVTRQAPDGTLGFVAVLALSQRLSLFQPADAKQLLDLVAWYRPVALSALGLSMAEYAYMSKSCSSADIICKQMATELLPFQYQEPGTDQRDRASPKEKFRIWRAVFRYQLMCNLFCHQLCVTRREEMRPRVEDWNLKHLFFSSFSPWVNEELMCVFVYLRRKVAQAYDDILAHDVTLFHNEIENTTDLNFISHIHWMLCMGLPFLSNIVSGGTLRGTDIPQFSTGLPATRAYNPQTILLYSKLKPEELTLNPPLRHEALTLQEWSSTQISQLDSRRAPQTSSFKAWMAAHLKSPISQTVFCDADSNLWLVGYVLWSIPDTSPVMLQKMYDDLRRAEPTFPRPGQEWGKDDLVRSRRQRRDIFFARGLGYWPRGGGDWSEIRGLTESQQEALEAKWLREGVIESTGESSSAQQGRCQTQHLNTGNTISSSNKSPSNISSSRISSSRKPSSRKPSSRKHSSRKPPPGNLPPAGRV